jgi:hypothetical protein
MHVASHDLFNMKLRTCLDTGTDSRKYSIKLVSFTSYPKYPILVLDYIQEEETDSELKQLKNKLLTKYGISCS